MKLLLIAAIVCSAFILAECGKATSQEEAATDLYEPKSKSCLEIENGVGRCLRSFLILLRKACEYSCNEDGSLRTSHCALASIFEDLPKCDDIICVATEGNGSDIDKPSTAATEPQNPEELPKENTEKTLVESATEPQNPEELPKENTEKTLVESATEPQNPEELPKENTEKILVESATEPQNPEELPKENNEQIEKVSGELTTESTIEEQ